MKSALFAFLALTTACSKKQDKPAPAPPPAAADPVAAEPAAAPPASYSPEAAKQALDQIGSCVVPDACPAFDTLVKFGAPAIPDLVAYVSDASKPLDGRRVAAAGLGKLKAADAGPKLVELGLASTDITAQSDFLKAAGECGGDATFAALTAQYDKENHGDDNDHLVPLLDGLKGFGEKSLTYAKTKMKGAKDETKYADVINEVATPADKDTVAALAGTAKDLMANNRLASKAIALGATDDKLWDVLMKGFASDSPYDHGDAGNFIAPIIDKAPADKKAKIHDLVKKALDKDPKDPMIEDGLLKTQAALGG
jgi:hypothetical protein